MPSYNYVELTQIGCVGTFRGIVIKEKVEFCHHLKKRGVNPEKPESRE
jgi:hypothetical protein